MDIGRLFLSYRSADARGVARGLATHFKNAGVQIFYDERNIQPGDEWHKDLDVAAERGAVGVVFLNPPYSGLPRNARFVRALIYHAPLVRWPLVNVPVEADLYSKYSALFQGHVHHPARSVLSSGHTFHYPQSLNPVPTYYSWVDGGLISNIWTGETKGSGWEPDVTWTHKPRQVQDPYIGRLEPQQTNVTDFTIEFDESMSEEDANQFLAFFREAAREVTGREPQIVELAGDE